MILTWMLYGMAIAVLLGGAALAAEHGARALRAPARGLWAGAIIASLVLPVVALVAPRAQEAAATAIAELPVRGAELSPDAVLDGSTAAPVFGALETRFVQLARALDGPLLVLWGLGSLALVAVLGVSWLRLRRVRREWTSALVERRFVRVSTDTGPAVVGCMRTEIVLPAWALELDPESRAMLMAHEREHVRARDPLLLAFGLLALALVPWNAAMWWQLRRLRLAVEMDCDARVLRECRDVRAYGALLVEVGRRTSRAPLAAAAFSEPATHLERRIRMMLTRPPSRPLVRAVALSTAAAALAIVACDVQPPMGPAPVNDVAVDALGANGQSYNALNSGANPDLRAALAEHFPDLLASGAGGKWLVTFVLDADGRILRASRQLDAASAVRARVPLMEQRAAVELRGSLEVAALRAPVARAASEGVEVSGGARARELAVVESLRRQAQSSPDVEPTEVRVPTVAGSARARLTETSARRPVGVVSMPGALDRLPADDIQSVEVLKGAAVSASDALAGVIWVRLRPGAAAATEAVRRY